MKTAFSIVGLLVALLPALAVRGGAQQGAVRRLDGTRVSGAEIDAAVTRLARASRVTGAGVAVLDGGRVAYVKAYGFRDLEKKLPMTPDTVMTAASLTKGAFSTMVMGLVEEKVVELDRPISAYLAKPLPEYGDYVDLAGDERWRKITLRMLLSHTSGLPNLRRFTDDGKLSFGFEPGARYAYSGEGMRLAQFVVEQATGKPLGESMQTRIFARAGMTRSAMQWEARFEDDVATRYDEEEKSLGQERRKRADAAGSMETTVGDYGRFLEALMQGKLLGAGTRAEMWRTQVRIEAKTQFPTFSTETTTANDGIALGYGLGWGVFETKYGRAFFKEGHDDGWRHYAVCFEKSGRGMVIMTNSSNGEDLFDPLLREVLGDGFTPVEWEGFKAAAGR